MNKKTFKAEGKRTFSDSFVFRLLHLYSHSFFFFLDDEKILIIANYREGIFFF